MKFSMFITEDAMQVNLEPENDHESRFMQMLGDDERLVMIRPGVDIGVCKGQYVRNFGEKAKVLAITIPSNKSTDARL